MAERFELTLPVRLPGRPASSACRLDDEPFLDEMGAACLEVLGRAVASPRNAASNRPGVAPRARLSPAAPSEQACTRPVRARLEHCKATADERRDVGDLRGGLGGGLGRAHLGVSLS